MEKKKRYVISLSPEAQDVFEAYVFLHEIRGAYPVHRFIRDHLESAAQELLRTDPLISELIDIRHERRAQEMTAEKLPDNVIPLRR